MNNDEARERYLPSELPRTYMGLLDDAFIRYEGDYATPAFFNKMIAKSIFFGGYLYINDGYLVNHPLAREYLMNPDSLLREMIYAGFIRILCRDKDRLADLVNLMEGNRTFDEFRNSDEWPLFRPTWELIADYVIDTNQYQEWPRFDMSQGFVKLIGNIWDKPANNLGFSRVNNDILSRVRDDFENRNPLNGNARDKYEQASATVVGFDLKKPKPGIEFESMRELMRPANESYHNNFGMMQTVEEGNRGIAVDTTLSASSDEIHESDKIRRGQLDNIELLRIPPTMQFNDGTWFHAFLNHTHPVGLAKMQYIFSVRNIVKATTDGVSEEQLRDRKKDLNDATRLYFSRISEHMKKRFGETFVRDALDTDRDILVTVATSSTQTKGNGMVLAGADAGIVLALRDSEGDTRQGLDILMSKLKNVEDVESEFNPTAERIALGDLRPQLASLAISREKANRHVEGIKRFERK